MDSNFSAPSRSLSENDAWRRGARSVSHQSSATNFGQHPALNVEPPTIPTRRGGRPLLRRGAVSASFLFRDACIATSALESLEITRISEADHSSHSKSLPPPKNPPPLVSMKSISKRSICDESHGTATTARCSVGRTASFNSTHSVIRRRTSESGNWSCDSSFTSKLIGGSDDEDEDIFTDDEMYVDLGADQKICADEKTRAPADLAPRMPQRSWGSLPTVVSQSYREEDDSDSED